MRTIKYLMFFVLGLFATVTLALAADKSFKAKLTGKESVPEIKTAAKGEADFKLAADGKELHYKITVKDMENITAAHIHLGKKGKNGPPVAGLFAGPKKQGQYKGLLSEGVIRDKDLMGDLQGKTVNDLVTQIKSGNTFVNVHSDAHPEGEIRGQIR